nr:MAG TPA: hypothetical protein [Caudoviricetes sp.]
MKHRTTVNANTNIHHLLWTRHDYNTGYCHSLRNYETSHYCQR